MPDNFAKRPEFGQMLETEVERVLADPIFQRSPVLSRLLRYLRIQTVNPSNAPITQFSIAVEGLGRREDYDQDAESYVRVQISRLRKSLAEYYARNQPGDGLCVFLRHGDYALRLAPPERAYPEQRGTAPAASLLLPVSNQEEPRQRAWRSSPRTPVATIFAVAVAVVAIWLAIMHIPDWLRKDPPITVPPRIFVAFDNQDTLKANSPFPELLEITEMEVRKVLTSSVVGRGSDLNSADYRLSIYFVPGREQKPEIFLRLTDANSLVHFAESIPIAADQEQFVDALDARLAAIFSSSGIIAKDLTRRFEHRRPKTGFECFLVSEAERASGQLIERTLDKCLSDYPDSPYAAFLHARRAYGEYQAAISQGKDVTRHSGGWDSLVLALNEDRFNAFANAVAAKIEFAEGDCKQALLYMTRAQARSLTDPAVNTSLLVDALPCASNPQERAEREKSLENLIAANPDADVGLRLQLVLAALELGDADTAHELLYEAVARPAADGNVAQALAMLDRALGKSHGEKPARAELRNAIARFVWNRDAQKAIWQTLGID